MVRQSTWRGEHCECGCRAFYTTRLTAFEWLAFRFGIFKPIDFKNLQAVSAPLGGPAEPFTKKWEEIQASLKEQTNG